MKKFFVFLLLLVSAAWAEDIVVLTETPVAEFTLPDGQVLKNAYVWRRNSAGLMIIHDGGNFFLNYKMLPDAWRAAYLGAPVEEVVKESDAEVEPELERDRYGALPYLEKVPELDAEVRDALLQADSLSLLEHDMLVMALMQAMLDEERKEAERLFLILDEKGYDWEALELEPLEAEWLYELCATCDGTGKCAATCARCDGSGECVKCVENENPHFKRKSAGKKTSKHRKQRKSKDDKGTSDHCTECRNTQACQKCNGEGKLDPVCKKCRGTGKLVNRAYCDAMRNHVLRKNTLSITGREAASIAAYESTGVADMLGELTELSPDALRYYRSSESDDTMDMQMLIAGFMHRLGQEELKEAKRFGWMIEINYPEQEQFEIERYIAPCEKCRRRGTVNRKCRTCSGSGDCVSCDGQGMTGSLKNLPCNACEKSGNCVVCEGDGKEQVKCTTCDGRGSTIDQTRAQIKLGLLIDELNAHYRSR